LNRRVAARTGASVSVPLRAILLGAPVVLSFVTRSARADDAAALRDPDNTPQRLGVSAATAYLVSGAGSGVAVSSGLRLTLGTRAALGADLGYGVLTASSSTQDRWWAMPTIAWVSRVDNAHLDVGAGFGVGASSGYASLADYVGRPFSPVWAFQLVPAARGHVVVAAPFGHDCDIFARIEAATLLLSGSQLGFRHGNASPGPADTTWFDVAAGVQFRLL
jgi:hypothetical protein